MSVRKMSTMINPIIDMWYEIISFFGIFDLQQIMFVSKMHARISRVTMSKIVSIEAVMNCVCMKNTDACIILVAQDICKALHKYGCVFVRDPKKKITWATAEISEDDNEDILSPNKYLLVYQKNILTTEIDVNGRIRSAGNVSYQTGYPINSIFDVYTIYDYGKFIVISCHVGLVLYKHSTISVNKISNNFYYVTIDGHEFEDVQYITFDAIVFHRGVDVFYSFEYGLLYRIGDPRDYFADRKRVIALLK